MASILSKVWQILRRAAWAPLSVLIFHAIVAKIGIRSHLDGVLHFSGGLAIAYFIYRSVIILREELGSLRELGIYLLTFALVCTVAVFWELGEFASDLFRHTHVQQSLHETMMDLFWGVLGAAVTILIVHVLEGGKARAGLVEETSKKR